MDEEEEEGDEVRGVRRDAQLFFSLPAIVGWKRRKETMRQAKQSSVARRESPSQRSPATPPSLEREEREEEGWESGYGW